ncbi:MAG: hypothetical protein KGL40_10560 [Rhodocyclaceae bacterium]|nr:hypothetical protein [Rhodocyclaceae bacterium]
MKKTRLALVIGGVGIAVAVFYFARSIDGDEKNEAPTAAHTNAEPGVALDADAAKRAGIETRKLQIGNYDPGVTAIATALPIKDLADVASGIAAAKAQAQKAAAVLESSRKEYQRLQTLHADDRNVSDRTLQAAEAVWRGDEANARAANVTYAATLASAQRKWGNVLSKAIAENGPLFRRLMEGKEVLVRVAAPSGIRLTAPPATVKVFSDDRNWLPAKLVSASSQTDPQVQGMAYYYTVEDDGVIPGMTLSAELPTGAEQAGVVLPDAAVVWWQGKPWFYQSVAENRFERRELVGAKQTSQGWFATVPDLPTVLQGAQSLLSEDLRNQIKMSGDD